MIKKLLLRLIGKDYDYKIEKLRKRGAEIGNIRISGDITIDNNWPFLLHIGNNTHLTNNVTILCHDYSWSVVKGYDGTLMGGVKPVYIGDNVFVGNGAIILMGARIEDNTIVAAGSVCTGHYPPNSVIAGSPAKVICTLDEYKKKRQERQLSEATEIVRHYRKCYHCNPPKGLIAAYSFLFEPRREQMNSELIKRLQLKGNFEESKKVFMNTTAFFANYDEFLNSIK